MSALGTFESHIDKDQMEGLSNADNNVSTSGGVKKKPVVVVDYAETPLYRAAKDRKSAGVLPVSEQTSAAHSGVENSNNESNSKNPLLTEEEQKVYDPDAPIKEGIVEAAVTLGVVCVIIGGFYAWKSGWFSAAKPKPN